MTREESERPTRSSFGDAPETPAAESDLLERCEGDHEELSPKETADCAGLELAERYENEEDGGS